MYFRITLYVSFVTKAMQVYSSLFADSNVTSRSEVELSAILRVALKLETVERYGDREKRKWMYTIGRKTRVKATDQNSTE